MSFPNKQVRKLTDEQKAEIVLAKEIRPTQTSTNQNIAEEFDVSLGLVAHMKYEALTDRQKEIYNQKRADLKYLAQNLTYNAMTEANARVIRGDGKLSEVVGAMKIANDIYRLETGQSTAITESVDTKAEMLRDFLRAKWPERTDSEVAEMMVNGDWGIPLEARRRVAGKLVDSSL